MFTDDNCLCRKSQSITKTGINDYSKIIRYKLSIEAQLFSYIAAIYNWNLKLKQYYLQKVILSHQSKICAVSVCRKLQNIN